MSLGLAFDRPLVLLLLAACVPALLGAGWRWHTTPSLTIVPADRASRATDLALRVLAAAPIAAIVLGLAGLHAPGATVSRSGQGAHVAVVLDRSLSMDEGFAIQGEKSHETKSHAAVRLIGAFFAGRPHDSFAVVAFSTAPILAMPLTTHRDAVAASIAAMDRPGLANTDIGAGLAMGLAQFDHDSPGAAHAVLLVTDGAGAIPEWTRDTLRAQAARHHAHLYYLYLRAGDDPPLADASNGQSDLDKPAGLDAFFRGLGTPYRGFEARDPNAVAAALRQIGGLETHALTYQETLKRRDLAQLCYGVAALSLLLSLLAQAAERDPIARPLAARVRA